jgi:FdhD protein
VFAKSLSERLPELPIIDERKLADPRERQTFVDRVFAHHRDENVARRSVMVSHVRRGVSTSQPDRVATEEPLEVRLHGRPFAVIMRTPGADRELAAGFLLSERVIQSADDLGTIEHCTQPEERSSNIVNVTLVGEAVSTIERVLGERRNVTTNSSCGLCGRQTLESLAVDVPPLTAPITVSSSVILSLPGTLRASQAVFDETGGLHAAGLFSRDGALVNLAEDVGRHNAVDKVVGRMLMREELPLSNHVLCVSGRTSFEIVQKALFAGIPIVAAVSAPSSLAVDLATAFGITLIGFVRGETFNIYAHGHRVTG